MRLEDTEGTTTDSPPVETKVKKTKRVRKPAKKAKKTPAKAAKKPVAKKASSKAKGNLVVVDDTPGVTGPSPSAVKAGKGTGKLSLPQKRNMGMIFDLASKSPTCTKDLGAKGHFAAAQVPQYIADLEHLGVKFTTQLMRVKGIRGRPSKYYSTASKRPKALA